MPPGKTFPQVLIIRQREIIHPHQVVFFENLFSNCREKGVETMKVTGEISKSYFVFGRVFEFMFFQNFCELFENN